MLLPRGCECRGLGSRLPRGWRGEGEVIGSGRLDTHFGRRTGGGPRPSFFLSPPGGGGRGSGRDPPREGGVPGAPKNLHVRSKYFPALNQTLPNDIFRRGIYFAILTQILLVLKKIHKKHEPGEIFLGERFVLGGSNMFYE